jgi:hypothetical protein
MGRSTEQENTFALPSPFNPSDINSRKNQGLIEKQIKNGLILTRESLVY